jgi:hypothetical protein
LVENQSGGVKAPDNSNPVKGDPAGALVPPTQVEAVPQGQDAVRISWADAGETEVAYRVDRSIAGGPWTAVAYRPVQKDHHEANPPVWVDFTAPGGKALRYRVVSVNSKDNDEGASQPTPAITLP